VHRRLVAWRWMARRFPKVYCDLEGALAESRRLNAGIETVLATQPSGRMLGANGRTSPAKGNDGRRRTERGGTAPQLPEAGRRYGRRTSRTHES